MPKQKTQKSVSKRLKVNGKKKVQRRSTSLGHSRANKRGTQLGRKKRYRGLTLSKQTIAKYI